MPASAAVKPIENKALEEFHVFKSRYQGDLNTESFSRLIEELRDIVPRGRYIPVQRGDACPACVGGFRFRAGSSRLSDVRINFTYVAGGERRDQTVEEFLEVYKFFATDCA